MTATSGTFTPAPAPRVRSDGEGSPVSTKWLVGILSALVLTVGGWWASGVERRIEDARVDVAKQRASIADQEKARELLESEVRGEMKTLRTDQQRTLRLVVLLAKRSGIEVAE